MKQYKDRSKQPHHRRCQPIAATTAATVAIKYYVDRYGKIMLAKNYHHALNRNELKKNRANKE
jgi:hypothetical protein